MRYCRTHNIDYFVDCPKCAVQAAAIGLRQKPSLAARLIRLQERVRTVREDWHTDSGLDARLNGIEAELGSLISEVRGEG